MALDRPKRFEVPSWDYIYELLIELAEKIKKSGFKPDIIVGISRGGWPPARVMSDLLENPNITSIRVEFYLDVYKTADKPTITQPISVPIKDKRVLIVDDVSDTGKTLKLVYEELTKQAREVKTATLYYKPWTDYEPDFYAKVTDAWIIFPWDRYEMIKNLGRKMLDEGKTLREVEEELGKIGLEPSIVKRFVRQIFGKIK